MLSVDRAEPSTPAFSLRFERGRGHLVLARQFDVTSEDRRGTARPIARVVELDLDLGPVRSGMRLRGGWSSIRTYRTELVSAVIELDVEALSGLVTGPSVTLEGALPGNRGVRLAMREGRRVVALDVVPRWRDGDLLLAVRDLRASERRGATALADLVEALSSLPARLDAEAGVLVLERPMRHLLAEALLPLGMRVPSVRGLAFGAPAVIVDGRGRALLRIAAGAAAGTGMGLASTSSSGGIPSPATLDHLDRVHAEARLVAGVTKALADGDLDAARHELTKIRGRLEPSSRAELHAACALETHDGDGEGLEEGSALLPALARARRAVTGPGASREQLERAVRAWLDREPSDALAASLLVRLAEEARKTDAPRSRWLARHAATRLARIPVHEQEDWIAPIAQRAVELAEGEIPRAIVEDLLPALGVERLLGSALELAAAGLPAVGSSAALDELLPEDTTAALALALEAIERPELADRAWLRLRQRADAETAVLVAARDERRGDRLAALESWDRAAALSAAAGRAADARRAWIRAGQLAHQLSLDEGAGSRLDRALSARQVVTPEDAVALVGAIRRADLVELAGRVEQLVIAAVAADGGESAELVGALEELLGWALERGAATRSRALHAALVRVRPERADLDELPLEPALPEEPRRRAERLRSEGRLDEAAAVLAALGKDERDAATLRAALDLAERSGARDTALHIIDTLLGWIGDGPVAESLRKRRERL
jgi:tetratricopeptide (TPR) repeat protein